MRKYQALIVFLVLCYINSYGQNEQKFVDRISTIFLPEYQLTKKIIFGKKQIIDDFSNVKFRNEGLDKTVSVMFASIKRIAKNTRLRFTIDLFKYANVNLATTKFKELSAVKQTHGEGVFSKDWNYVLLEGNLILRLEGGCYYSEREWGRLKALFVKAKIESIGNKNKENIECSCGGSCK